jgi:hypothetical protein
VATRSVLALRQFSSRSSHGSATTAPGQWHLCYACHTCQGDIPVLACDEHASIALGGSGTMVMPCPHCQAKHPYRVQELRKVQTPHTH